MKSCIAVLTRGYIKTNRYKNLIKRNRHIGRNLKDKSIDILFFHEGNITEEQQIFIKGHTPNLNIKFIDISPIAFNPGKKNIPAKIIPQWVYLNLGYRHMCSFWFVNFFEAVKEYDKMLRIDEDCFINSSIDEIFSHLDKYTFITGLVDSDSDFVTEGLNKFSLDFLDKYKEDYFFTSNGSKKPGGPYTNVIGFALEKIRNNDLFQKYRIAVDESNMIYERRWGDLPLWGEVIYYIFGVDSMKVDSSIKYFHGSHEVLVN